MLRRLVDYLTGKSTSSSFEGWFKKTLLKKFQCWAYTFLDKNARQQKPSWHIKIAGLQACMNKYRNGINIKKDWISFKI